MSIAVYLAGAMDYVGDYATGWRKESTFLFNQRGYRVLDPTSIPEEKEMTPEEIAHKNLFMQKKADILVVEYMLENRAYIGTDFEMAWAKLNGQPTVVMCSEQNKNRPYMRYMTTKFVEGIEEAVEYISVHYPIR
jgi:hypothetical protein